MQLYYEKLRSLRKKTGLQTKVFCERVGISISTLWHWEKGSKTPPEKKVRKLAKVLKVPVEEISDLTSEFKKSDHDLSDVISIWSDSSGTKGRDVALEFENIIEKLKKQHKYLTQYSIITKTILSSLNSIIYIKDINQKYLLVNDAFLESLSLNSDFKVEGRSDYDLYSINEANEIIIQDKQVLMTGKPVINYSNYLPGSKRKRYALISKHPIFDSENKIAGVIGAYNDITEMRKAGRTREILEIYIGAMTDCLSVFFSNNYKYLYVNNAYENVFGYPVGKFYEGGLIDFFAKSCVHPDDRANEEKYLREKKWPKSRKFRIIRPDGVVRWLEGSVNKRTYFGKECCISVNRDITDRIYQTAFSDLLELILNHSEDVLWIKEKEGEQKIIYISNSVKALYGYTADRFYNDNSFWKNKCLYESDRKWNTDFRCTSCDNEIKTYRIQKSNGNILHLKLKTFELPFLGKECICFIESRIPEDEYEKYSREKEIRKEIAEKLIKENFEYEKITDISGLTLAEIKAIDLS